MTRRARALPAPGLPARALPALAAACLLLSACGGDDTATPALSPTPAAVPTAVPTVEAGTPLELRGDGLALGDQRLPFGTSRAVVLPVLAALVGTPQEQSVPCSQGQRTALGAEGFDLLFDGDRFVGWDDSTGSVATAQGLKVGSTRADVRRTVPGASFTAGPAGAQFTSPSGLGGFLESDSESARVVGLTGGETCVAG